MIIVTDTGSDILEQEAKEMNLLLVSISSRFADAQFDKNTQESFAEFFAKLESSEELPVSSQPSPEEFVSIYEKAKEMDEDVLVITISSKLSGTYNGAVLAKDIAEYDRVYVVDSLQASLSERIAVMCALKKRDEGLSAAEIAEYLEEAKNRIILTGTPTTLLYLKKGGRISPLIANVGEKLNIKPILALEEGVIVSHKNVRGIKAAKKELQNYIKAHTQDPYMPIFFAHSNNEENCREFLDETMADYAGKECLMYPVGPAIGTHIGPGALLVGMLAEK